LELLFNHFNICLMKYLYKIDLHQMVLKQSLVKILFLYIAFLMVSINVFSQSKILLNANFTDAKFHKIDDKNPEIKTFLGSGSVELKLDKDSKNIVEVSKEGFVPVLKEFPKTTKWDKQISLNLVNKIVDIQVEPVDAEIFVDGKLEGTNGIKLIIPQDGILNVEVKKNGFLSQSKTYYNSVGKEEPPIKDFFELKDRIVKMEIIPQDALVSVNGANVGKGNFDLKILFGECVTVNVDKEGFAYVSKVYCNNPETDPLPPLKEKIVLEDRILKLYTVPNDAKIEVNGKFAGVGNFDLKINKGVCVDVRITREGYQRFFISYCNQPNMPEPPISEYVELKLDEAYNSSVPSEIANVRITIPVNKSLTSEEAWKTLSSIITRYFDILEIVDYNSGYLTTSWQIQNFEGSGVIRTRVIVSSAGNSTDIVYAFKIISQYSKADKIDVKNDQNFEDWGRLLKKYVGLIEEIKERIQ
jgi:hypothetical protein